MRVLSVIHGVEFGGPQNQALRLAPALRTFGIETIVAIPPGEAANRLMTEGISVVPIDLSRVRAVISPAVQLKTLARIPKDIYVLRQLAQYMAIDVIQLNGLINPHGAFAARSLGLPVVWQLLDTRPPVQLRRAFTPLVNGFADVVMPIGNAVLAAHPGIDIGCDQTVVFFPPVDLSQYRSIDVTSIRQELGIPSEVQIVGCVANINPQKGYEYFIDAAAQVKRAHSAVAFVIAGKIYSDHPTHCRYFQDVQRRAASLGLVSGRDIFFLGTRTDIPNVLAAIDVFALASVPNSEGTPTVILEAMASGKPVVATDVGAVSEVVADSETGFVVPSLDPDSMAQRIVQLLDNPERARIMGMAGRKRVEQEFSLDRCVAAHVDAYVRAIAHRRASRFSRV